MCYGSTILVLLVYVCFLCLRHVKTHWWDTEKKSLCTNYEFARLDKEKWKLKRKKE